MNAEQRKVSAVVPSEEVQNVRDLEPPMIDVNPWHRYPIVAVNLFILLCSGMAVALAVYSLFIRWDEIHYVTPVITMLVNIEIPVILVGVVAFVISCMGFVGALREHIKLLEYYSYALCVLMTLDIVFTALVLVGPILNKNSVKSILTIDLIKHYRDNDDFQRLVDHVQFSYECCGVTVDSYRDWNYNMYFNCSNDNLSSERCSVPPSCCRHDDKIVTLEAMLAQRFCGQRVLLMTEQEAWTKVYTRSCTNAILARMRSYSWSLALFCIASFIFLLVLSLLTERVHEDLLLLTEFYEKYKDQVEKGEDTQGALDNVPKGCVVVFPKKARIEEKSKKYNEPVLVSEAPKLALPPPYSPRDNYGVPPGSTRFRKEDEFMLQGGR
ncbi:tetraspanin-33-like isoform X2 [Ornithodoros turicata]|uniref:tetraspanin-33-like isoform X2 n=1 Tax=Ornithodoros turicata TaxID=34597 RepID=UPI0031399BF6